MTPAEADPFVRHASARWGVDPGLVHAVIRVESGYNPDAVSRAGARGLMQIMPATWDAIRQRLGLPDRPFDAAGNVTAGTWFLARLLERYQGDLHRALAAYNAGPGNVDRHGWQPWSSYVEAVQRAAMFPGSRPRPASRPTTRPSSPPSAPSGDGGAGILLLVLAALWAWKGR